MGVTICFKNHLTFVNHFEDVCEFNQSIWKPNYNESQLSLNNLREYPRFSSLQYLFMIFLRYKMIELFMVWERIKKTI